MLLTNLVLKNYSTQLVRLKCFLFRLQFWISMVFFLRKVENFSQVRADIWWFQNCTDRQKSSVTSLVIISICSWYLNRLACKKCNSGEEEINKFMKEIKLTDFFSFFYLINIYWKNICTELNLHYSTYITRHHSSYYITVPVGLDTNTYFLLILTVTYNY